MDKTSRSRRQRAAPIIALALLSPVIAEVLRPLSFPSSNPAWEDLNRLALLVGALLASMLGGAVVLIFGRALAIDRIGQATFSVIAIAWLMRLARRVQGHKQEPGRL